MLKELYIENLAIIKKATIPFSEKLNVFSGETGAGKSILIGGISAIMGGRVSKDIVRNGTDKATVTALFTEISPDIKKKLNEYGYTAEDDEITIEREISADGKSSARICGKTATAAVLREIASDLVNIHGQHDNQLLQNIEKQRELLDNYGGLCSELNEFADKFREFSAISRRIKKAAEESELKDEKAELLKEKIKEVSSYKFKTGEEEQVERELSAVRNAEAIQNGLATVYACLNGSEDANGAVNALLICKQEIAQLSKYIDCAELKERFDSVYIELDDIKSEVSSFLSDNTDNSRKLTYLEERMSDILRIKRKYSMEIDELIGKTEQWQNELEELDGGDDFLEKLAQQRKMLGDELKKRAQEITEKRKKTADALVKKISAELVYLDMPDVKLVFDISKDKITVNGMDRIEMLISVNKGEEPKPMAKIASGGELSRIMLAIKNVLATSDDIPTMIFDEIDTGISGRAAQKVGEKLAQIAEKRQVLCVTHLAQIAAMADNHLLIEKTNDEKRTFTNVYPLDFEGRKREIARIISGDEENAISLRNAEELLSRKERKA